MIKTVVFDLDDTLYPERDYVLSGFSAVNDWFRQHLAVEGFFETAKKLYLDGSRGNIFDLTLQHLKLEDSSAMIQSLIKVYREHKPKISLFNDAKWALGYFRNIKKLGLLTDGYLVSQKNKVASLGIENYFNIVIYSDLYGRNNWKPSQLPYLKIMETLGFLGPEYVYVGDNPAKDFVSAKKLGWQTIQISRPGGEYSSHVPDQIFDAQKKISSLYELKELIP